MAANGEIYLGPSGSEVLLSPFGRKLRIIPEALGRSDRTAGGKLVTDLIAVKYKFEMPYEMIDGTALTTILTLYDLHESLTLLIYTSPTTYFLSDTGSAPIVKMSTIERERLLLLGDGIWSGVSLTLEEI